MLHTPPPTPFLQLVAETYLDHEAELLQDCCFVFPNRRSATFFARYLRQSAADREMVVIAPEVTTVERLAASLVPELSEASRLEQLFALFTEYRQLSPEAMDFDRFRFWGDMLLNDFNDVDRYMVDAADLFDNVKRLREINSTFLTDEQRRVVNLYLGEELPEYDPDVFWSHIPHAAEAPEAAAAAHTASASFLRLWEVLAQLYERFHASLGRRGLSTSGRIFRTAVERLRIGANTDALTARRYVFVGFNVLTTVERMLFSRLRALGRADFYWDLNTPVLTDKTNSVVRLVRRNAQEFGSLYPLAEPERTWLPQVDVVAVPSRTGQAKYAGALLGSYVASGVIPDCTNAITTAVVLPDESMLVPMIHAVPPELTSVNVTMGLPMRHNPVASLVRRIVSLQLRTRLDRNAGDTLFYYEDILAVATHPLLYAADLDECQHLVREISRSRLIMVPLRLISELAPGLVSLFRPLADDAGFDEVAAYLEGVLDFMDLYLGAPAGAAVADSRSERISVVVEAYREALQQLRVALARYRVPVGQSTVLQLVEAAVNSATITFTGEPLRGLQLMGMLETRALDFDNVIMLAMNERVYPRRHHARSFIPEALRAGYKMSTAEFRDAATAYNFFRLLSRSQRVTILYDSRHAGVRSGECSRYVSQLLMLFSQTPAMGTGVRHIAASYLGIDQERSRPFVPKTERVMQQLQRMLDPEGDLRLSPSAINRYIECPLHFYLTCVEGLNPPDDIVEYVDASTYGSVVHAVVERLYISQRVNPRDNHETVTVTAAMIRNFIDNPHLVDREVTRAINRLYKRRVENFLRRERLTAERDLTPEQAERLEADLLTPLQGDAFAMAKVVRQNVMVMLREELKLVPFELLSAELRFRGRLKLSDELTVNYSQIIDRVDRVGGRLRIVDYKTGSDPNTSSSVENLFNPNQKKRPKAILQLLLYCNVYARTEGYDGPIQPLLYNLRQMAQTGAENVKIDRTELLDYRTVNDQFWPRLAGIIKTIFDPQLPFAASCSDDHCKYCNFKNLCRVEEE